MNYNLNSPEIKSDKQSSALKSLLKLWPLIKGERQNLIPAFALILISAALSLTSPILIGYTVDHYITHRDYHGVLISAVVLLIIYLANLFIGYLQTMLMGTVGQRLLYSLRHSVFEKLQALPVAFFNQNKAGDLISRINNDTDKLNQFFSQSLMQFIGSIFIMLGAAIFLVSVKPLLGLAALAPALLIFIFTRIISPWVRSKNIISLSNVGGLSAEIQESINNFKVILAFNRQDYFRKRFLESNQKNYKSAVSAGIANNIFTPVYSLAGNLAQLIILVFGIYLIINGHLSVGILISFISYATNFYNPLRQLAALWANFQVAMAGWQRISEILNLSSDLQTFSPEKDQIQKDNCILEFRNVSFEYEDGKKVLQDISFCLEEGKTYALVGPTGGGKTTTASLMARLYDPTEGEVYLLGRDIRSFDQKERTDLVGFILQEPFLFNGTLKDNILYGNDLYKDLSEVQFAEVVERRGLGSILDRFDGGLETKIEKNESISLGQKQLIAFVRAVLREPKVLILDEATANVDTVTEQLLEKALDFLPVKTTKVIIAHRLNTIENADSIFFVNSGQVVNAGTMAEAVNMLLHGRLKS